MSTILASREEAIDRIRQLEPQLRAWGVQRLALFGSFARGNPRSDSDVDLLVEFAPGRKTFDAFLGVCDLLEATLQRRVELLTFESLSPHLGPQILREAKDVVAVGLFAAHACRSEFSDRTLRAATKRRLPLRRDAETSVCTQASRSSAKLPNAFPRTFGNCTRSLSGVRWRGCATD